ncbi:probable methyltransferase PMT10 [Tanacetum coccineum]
MKDIKNETNVDHTLEMSNDDDLINLYPTLLYVRDIIILVHECMRSLTSILFHVTTLIRDEAAFEPHHWNMTLQERYATDGILLLEVNRMLRAGGFFVWATQPVYNIERITFKNTIRKILVMPKMEDLTVRMCWELKAKEGFIAIWRKPVNNTYYIARGLDIHPPMCDANDDPDNVWYLILYSFHSVT